MKSTFTCLVSICSVFLITSSFGQTGPVIHETRIYKAVQRQELSVDMFYTAVTKNKSNNPAIAFFHGGGWAFGTPSEFFGACKRFARKGFITFSFQYRLSIQEDGTFPHPEITPVESVKDARSALRWIKENATSLGVDTTKIVAGGQSAGGQLALSTAMIEDINESTDNLEIDPTPKAFILYSSNVNTIEAWADRLLGDKRDQIHAISPYHNIKSGLPPTIAFHGKDDVTVKFFVVRWFEQKTTEFENHFELIPYEGRKHYLGEGNEKYATYFDEEIMERTDDFLKKFNLMPEN